MLNCICKNCLTQIILTLFLGRFFSFSREKSAVSHSITWRHPLAVKRVDMEGATAYGVSGLLNYSHFPLFFGLSWRLSLLYPSLISYMMRTTLS